MKKHLFWIIENRVEVCLLDGVPSTNCIGPNAGSDAEIILEFEKTNADRFEKIKTKEDYWNLTKELIEKLK